MPDTPAQDEVERQDERRVFSWLATHTLGGVTHKISGALALLSAEPPGQPLTPDQRALVGIARDSTAQLMQLSEDIQLLTHAAAQTLELHPQRIPLTTLLRQSTEQAQSPTPTNPLRDIQTHIPAAMPPVWCDSALTRRALAAIVENALRFTPRDSQVCIDAHKRGEWAIITVRDYGDGVPTCEADAIFEPLYSGRRRRVNVGVGLGVGLGLAVARVSIEAQGGEIALAPVDGPGASFVVKLPLTPPRRAASDGSAATRHDDDPASGVVRR